MNVRVVTVTNRIPTEPYYRFCAWKNSLARFGVEPSVLGMDEPWHGLITKPRTLLRWLRSGACKDVDCLIFTDSWDVAFAASPLEIATEWSAIGRPWICGAERNLFPPADEKAWPESGTPYRFLNSGAIISTPSQMEELLTVMNPDALPGDYERPDGSHYHANDQETFQQLFLKQPIPMRLDTECRFVWNLCDVPPQSCRWEGDRPVNIETGTRPGILHANGGAKEKEIFLEALTRLNLN